MTLKFLFCLETINIEFKSTFNLSNSTISALFMLLQGWFHSVSICNSNLMEKAFHCNTILLHPIAANICTRHASTKVVTCQKVSSYHLSHKHLGHFFSKCNLFSLIVHNRCNILVRNCTNTTNILSALWIQMAWCFSTRASVVTVLNMHGHPYISSGIHQMASKCSWQVPKQYFLKIQCII